MSLRTFHIFFVSAALLMCAVFGVWALREYFAAHGTAMAVMAGGAMVSAVGLAGYGVWFLRKTRGLSW